MEPVTHLLTGACLARTGFHRRIAYVTGAMAVAAEFPDVDTVWSLRGPVSGFEHHRGITHSFVGLPFEAAFLFLCVFAWHSWRERRGRVLARTRGLPKTASGPRVRWLAFYGCLLLALLSHLLLDFTNNYGLRPFFPFDSRWWAGSIVFIFDPLIFLLLLGGLLLPELFALIRQEIEGKRVGLRGSGWARAALLGVSALWCLRAYEHSRALALAGGQTARVPFEPAANDTSGPGGETELPAQPLLRAGRMLASPDPFSPFRWYTATDFGSFYLLGTADTLRSEVAPGATLQKPVPSPALSLAEATELGRAYLDWSPMPWITVAHSGSAHLRDDGRGPTTVLFEDVRFMGSVGLLQRGGRPPLSGVVELEPDGGVTEEIDGRIQP